MEDFILQSLNPNTDPSLLLEKVYKDGIKLLNKREYAPIQVSSDADVAEFNRQQKMSGGTGMFNIPVLPQQNFDDIYNQNLLTYNSFSQQALQDRVYQYVQDESNALLPSGPNFVPFSQRVSIRDLSPQEKLMNHLGQHLSGQLLNEWTDPTKTISELAQQVKVRDEKGKILDVTPEDLGTWKVGQWGKSLQSLFESPAKLINPAYWFSESNKQMQEKYPFVDIFGSKDEKALQLATYDTDGFHEEIINDIPTKVPHKKGELKLDNDGKPFYQFVPDGTRVNGQLVLSGFDVLTREGSFWNNSPLGALETDDVAAKDFAGQSRQLAGTVLRTAIKAAPAIASIAHPVFGLAYLPQIAGEINSLGLNILESTDAIAKTDLKSSPLYRGMVGAETTYKTNAVKSEAYESTVGHIIVGLGDVVSQLGAARGLTNMIGAYGNGLFTVWMGSSMGNSIRDEAIMSGVDSRDAAIMGVSASAVFTALMRVNPLSWLTDSPSVVQSYIREAVKKQAAKITVASSLTGPAKSEAMKEVSKNIGKDVFSKIKIGRGTASEWLNKFKFDLAAPASYATAMKGEAIEEMSETAVEDFFKLAYNGLLDAGATFTSDKSKKMQFNKFQDYVESGLFGALGGAIFRGVEFYDARGLKNYDYVDFILNGYASQINAETEELRKNKILGNSHLSFAQSKDKGFEDLFLPADEKNLSQNDVIAKILTTTTDGLEKIVVNNKVFAPELNALYKGKFEDIKAPLKDLIIDTKTDTMLIQDVNKLVTETFSLKSQLTELFNDDKSFSEEKKNTLVKEIDEREKQLKDISSGKRGEQYLMQAAMGLSSVVREAFGVKSKSTIKAELSTKGLLSTNDEENNQLVEEAYRAQFETFDYSKYESFFRKKNINQILIKDRLLELLKKDKDGKRPSLIKIIESIKLLSDIPSYFSRIDSLKKKLADPTIFKRFAELNEIIFNSTTNKSLNSLKKENIQTNKEFVKFLNDRGITFNEDFTKYTFEGSEKELTDDDFENFKKMVKGELAIWDTTLKTKVDEKNYDRNNLELIEDPEEKAFLELLLDLDEDLDILNNVNPETVTEQSLAILLLDKAFKKYSEKIKSWNESASNPETSASFGDENTLKEIQDMMLDIRQELAVNQVMFSFNDSANKLKEQVGQLIVGQYVKIKATGEVVRVNHVYDDTIVADNGNTYTVNDVESIDNPVKTLAFDHFANKQETLRRYLANLSILEQMIQAKLNNMTGNILKQENSFIKAKFNIINSFLKDHPNSEYDDLRTVTTKSATVIAAIQDDGEYDLETRKKHYAALYEVEKEFHRTFNEKPELQESLRNYLVKKAGSESAILDPESYTKDGSRFNFDETVSKPTIDIYAANYLHSIFRYVTYYNDYFKALENSSSNAPIYTQLDVLWHINGFLYGKSLFERDSYEVPQKNNQSITHLRNITLVTGDTGVGKTFLTKLLAKSFFTRFGDKGRVFVTAGKDTKARSLFSEIRNDNPENTVSLTLVNTLISDLESAENNAITVIIDEVSLISSQQLLDLDTELDRINATRKRAGKEAIKVVTFGDYKQMSHTDNNGQTDTYNNFLMDTAPKLFTKIRASYAELSSLQRRFASYVENKVYENEDKAPIIFSYYQSSNELIGIKPFEELKNEDITSFNNLKGTKMIVGLNSTDAEKQGFDTTNVEVFENPSEIQGAEADYVFYVSSSPVESVYELRTLNMLFGRPLKGMFAQIIVNDDEFSNLENFGVRKVDAPTKESIFVGDNSEQFLKDLKAETLELYGSLSGQTPTIVNSEDDEPSIQSLTYEMQKEEGPFKDIAFYTFLIETSEITGNATPLKIAEAIAKKKSLLTDSSVALKLKYYKPNVVVYGEVNPAQVKETWYLIAEKNGVDTMIGPIVDGNENTNADKIVQILNARKTKTITLGKATELAKVLKPKVIFDNNKDAKHNYSKLKKSLEDQGYVVSSMFVTKESLDSPNGDLIGKPIIMYTLKRGPRDPITPSDFVNKFRNTSNEVFVIVMDTEAQSVSELFDKLKSDTKMTARPHSSWVANKMIEELKKFVNSLNIKPDVKTNILKAIEAAETESKSKGKTSIITFFNKLRAKDAEYRFGINFLEKLLGDFDTHLKIADGKYLSKGLKLATNIVKDPDLAQNIVSNMSDHFTNVKTVSHPIVLLDTNKLLASLNISTTSTSVPNKTKNALDEYQKRYNNSKQVGDKTFDQFRNDVSKGANSEVEFFENDNTFVKIIFNGKTFKEESKNWKDVVRVEINKLKDDSIKQVLTNVLDDSVTLAEFNERKTKIDNQVNNLKSSITNTFYNADKTTEKGIYKNTIFKAAWSKIENVVDAVARVFYTDSPSDGKVTADVSDFSAELLKTLVATDDKRNVVYATSVQVHRDQKQINGLWYFKKKGSTYYYTKDNDIIVNDSRVEITDRTAGENIFKSLDELKATKDKLRVVKAQNLHNFVKKINNVNTDQGINISNLSESLSKIDPKDYRSIIEKIIECYS